MRFDKWHALRATAWAFIWMYMNPELMSIEAWHHTLRIIWLIGMYLVSGLILETGYRWLAWGRIFTEDLRPPVIRPDCTEHPWICLANEHPAEGKDLEVLCADRKRRLGTSIRRDDGLLGIAVRFTAADEKELAKDAYSLRPTHWRELKEPVDQEKENR